MILFKSKRDKNISATQKRKNILVTGGAGFIGSHLCEELVKQHNVICIDNFVTSNVENIRFLLQSPNFEFINYDLNEPLDLNSFPELKKFQVEVYGLQEIYNLACPTSARNFDNLLVETAKANSVLVNNILNLARTQQAKLVHASSAVVYGPRKDNSYFSENHNGLVDFLSPRACYDEGKRFAETLINSHNLKYGTDYKMARIFRVYGPRLALNDGQMISDFIFNALDNKDLEIFGDENFSTALCYVSDIVRGLIKLMESDHVGPMNLGSNTDTLITDVAQKIINMTDSKSKIVHKESLHFITQLGLPDISLAKSRLGWYPLVTLDDGLKETLEYTRAHKQLLSTIMMNGNGSNS